MAADWMRNAVDYIGSTVDTGIGGRAGCGILGVAIGVLIIVLVMILIRKRRIAMNAPT